MRALVVSIHDVSPRTQAATEAIISDLAAWGVSCTSLLIIPDHHRTGHFLKDENFCEWLAEMTSRGHEAVVHGYFHSREKKQSDNPWQRLVTESYTAGEGEFYDMDEAKAYALVTQAREQFRSAGLEPGGFIAPAWLLSEEAEGAVARAGFRYTTRIGEVSDLESGIDYPSQSLVYSVRAGWRRAMSLAWNSFLLRKLGDRSLIRLGLHPPDWKYPAIRDHARKCIARALAGREAMTYDDWLGRQRNAAEARS